MKVHHTACCVRPGVFSLNTNNEQFYLGCNHYPIGKLPSWPAKLRRLFAGILKVLQNVVLNLQHLFAN